MDEIQMIGWYDEILMILLIFVINKEVLRAPLGSVIFKKKKKNLGVWTHWSLCNWLRQPKQFEYFVYANWAIETLVLKVALVYKTHFLPYE